MRIIILALVLITSFNTYAQIGNPEESPEIFNVGSVERYTGEYYSYYTLGYIEMEKDIRYYALVFTNENTLFDNVEADIRTLSFFATQEEFDSLYNFLKKGFKSDLGRFLELGQDLIKTTPKTSRFLYILVDSEDGESASFKLTKRQLDKLFGKK